MGLPNLIVKLFPPKAGKGYAAAGHLTIPLSDVHALAEWLLSQEGEFDNYLNETVVKLLAFEFHNRSKSGNDYRTIKLKDPAEFSAGSSPSTHTPVAAATGSSHNFNTFDEDIPF
jgi:hypothetical protein